MGVIIISATSPWARVSWDVPPWISQFKNWSVIVREAELDTVVYTERTKEMYRYTCLQMHAVGKFSLHLQYWKATGKAKKSF